MTFDPPLRAVHWRVEDFADELFPYNTYSNSPSKLRFEIINPFFTNNDIQENEKWITVSDFENTKRKKVGLFGRDTRAIDADDENFEIQNLFHSESVLSDDFIVGFYLKTTHQMTIDLSVSQTLDL